jgi:hypothetical protein
MPPGAPRLDPRKHYPAPRLYVVAKQRSEDGGQKSVNADRERGRRNPETRNAKCGRRNEGTKKPQNAKTLIEIHNLPERMTISPEVPSRTNLTQDCALPRGIVVINQNTGMRAAD